MNVPLFIARRYLISKKSNNAINIISWISVAAIAISTAAVVVILSFMNGLTGMVQDLYNSFDPDIEITPVKGKTFIPDSVQMEKIKKIKGVRYLNFSIEDIAMLEYGSKQAVTTIKAVGDDYFKMSGLDKRVQEGQPVLRTQQEYFIIPGKGIVYQLSLNVHDRFNPVSLYAPKRGRAMVLSEEDAYIEEKIAPSAYFSINDEFDFKYALTHIDVARRLFEYEKEVSTADIGLEDLSYSDAVQEEIKKILGEGFHVKNRFEQNKALFTTLKSEKLVVFLVLIFILVVATFNIIGSIIMLIIEKKKDIVTLNNMGAGLPFIRRIFITEGLLITCLGAFSGLLIGLIVCLVQLNFHPITMQGLGEEIPYPMKMLLTDFVLVIAGVFVISILAAWFPVRLFTSGAAVEKFRVQA